MEKELKQLMLRIRKKRPKRVFIYSPRKYGVLWDQMSAEMVKRDLYGGLIISDLDLCNKGYDNFLCMGIPVILKPKGR